VSLERGGDSLEGRWTLERGRNPLEKCWTLGEAEILLEGCRDPRQMGPGDGWAVAGHRPYVCLLAVTVG
jgi:hypothetical protein